jgi:hypothetical protein
MGTEVVKFEPASQPLVRYEQLKRALAEVQDIDEVVGIIDQAEALRVYVRQRGETLEMQNGIAEIKLRAERRAGELIRQNRFGCNNAPGMCLTSQPARSNTSFIRDCGLTWSASSRWQLESELPEDEFVRRVEVAKVAGIELTSNWLRQQVRKWQGISSELDIIKPSDWWAFGNPKWEQPEGFPGSIPGEIYANALYYFAPREGIAVDPMAGSGMLRRVYNDRRHWQKDSDFQLQVHLSDREPRSPFRKKHRIKKHDATTPLSFKADWIFLDPPYFGISDRLYEGPMAEATNYQDYLKGLAIVISAMADSLNPQGVLCVFLPKYRPSDAGQSVLDVPRDVCSFVALAEESKIRWLDRAYVNRGTQRSRNGAYLNTAAKKNRMMLSDTCELNVFRRVS